MSDGDSFSGQVTDQIKDLGAEGIKDATKPITPKNIFKEVVNQIVGKKDNSEKTPEEVAKENAETQNASQRIAEIDAEIKRIAEERAKLTGPEIEKTDSNTTNTNEDLMRTQTTQQQNLQVTLAQTKGETGRGTKG